MTTTAEQLTVTLMEGVTYSGLRILLQEQNPHSKEYRRYTVTLIQDGKKYICGDKGVYKSRAAAMRIYNQVITAY